MRVPGEGEALNQELEKAGRVADFLEFGELMCRDALEREESCGGHFRAEYQDDEGEANRAQRQMKLRLRRRLGIPRRGHRSPKLHKEQLEFENVKLSTRSYK